jgi:hypothetical protein
MTNFVLQNKTNFCLFEKDKYLSQNLILHTHFLLQGGAKIIFIALGLKRNHDSRCDILQHHVLNF